MGRRGSHVPKLLALGACCWALAAWLRGHWAGPTHGAAWQGPRRGGRPEGAGRGGGWQRAETGAGQGGRWGRQGWQDRPGGDGAYAREQTLVVSRDDDGRRPVGRAGRRDGHDGRRDDRGGRREEVDRNYWRDRLFGRRDDREGQSDRQKWRSLQSTKIRDLVMLLQDAGESGRFRTVDLILRRLLEGQLLKTDRDYEMVMEELTLQNRWREAFALFDEREKRGFGLNSRLSLLKISVSAKARRWQECLRLFHSMKKRDATIPLPQYNDVLMSLIDKRSRKWEEALEIYTDMEAHKRRDKTTFIAAMGLCRFGRLWQKALDMMDEMLTYELLPNEEMFQTVIVLTGEAKKWEAALATLDAMWRLSVPPNQMTYSVMVDICRKSGEPAAATDVMLQMRRRGMLPDAPLTSAVRDACRALGQPDLMDKFERAFGPADLIRKLGPAGSATRALSPARS